MIKDDQNLSVLVGDTRHVGSPNETRNPYEVLDDLMWVIEALSPQWPERDTVIGPGIFRL